MLLLDLTAHCNKLLFLLLFVLSFPVDSSVRFQLSWQFAKPVRQVSLLSWKGRSGSSLSETLFAACYTDFFLRSTSQRG